MITLSFKQMVARASRLRAGWPPVRALLASLLATVALTAKADNCPLVSPLLQKAMLQHIAHIRADEYCPARSVKSEGNLSVLIYTAEGACNGNRAQQPGTCSNDWVRYMVGENKGRLLAPVIVGGKGRFEDDTISLAKGLIKISGLAAGKSDASCCPGTSAVRTFRVSEGRFVEVSH